MKELNHLVYLCTETERPSSDYRFCMREHECKEDKDGGSGSQTTQGSPMIMMMGRLSILLK